MAGWHHWLDRCESQWTPGVGGGRGGLVCCNSWGQKESAMTERLIWSDLNYTFKGCKGHESKPLGLVSLWLAIYCEWNNSQAPCRRYASRREIAARFGGWPQRLKFKSEIIRQISLANIHFLVRSNRLIVELTVKEIMGIVMFHLLHLDCHSMYCVSHCVCHTHTHTHVESKDGIRTILPWLIKSGKILHL